MILIFTTVNKKSTATKIGRMLLEKHLIVCYNLFPVESAYWWKGEIVDDQEILMILKTSEVNFEKVQNYIKKHSGYEVPEIIAVKPSQVNSVYLNWLNSQTKSLS